MATKVPNNLLNSPLVVPAALALGTSTPDAKSLLQMDSTTQGFLPPRMTTAQITAMGVVPVGMTVFNTDLGTLQTYA